ncbi:non-hydrolyzing UDP-N-acetylglucosamine 2-epimerase [Kiloniella majae]|uniref:non-hydrolyzing UDP-N-acetylglucosamine 2-epimerase n=1 Tax=Kiloniella majae TaxID=1938558 RepID=UPI000A2779BC|nr:UDP-N-acetylglucosamine 2-epimerase (non-hydrolyzing) [Kiloniella majae]
MKVVTVLGTRPEIIRLSRVIARLDTACDHVVIHTGQNYDPKLSEVFFDELNVRAPDDFLNVRGDTLGQQLGKMLEATEEVLIREKPDRLLLLGDTNSSICAIIAKRMGIPVFHMEAGNRCYDDRVPEEVNRRIIDHSSDILMPYTERSRANLIHEGVKSDRIFVTGNPIYEVLEFYKEKIAASKVLKTQGLNKDGYFLVTLHRAENVDTEDRLRQFTTGLARINERYNLPVLVSTHPRTRARLDQFGMHDHGGDIRYPEAFGLFDFITLEKNARCVLSDSGTVQEECSIFGIPNVTLRDVTERPETIECGSNILSGADPDSIERCTEAALSLGCDWTPPTEYLAPDVSGTVARILLGYHCHLDSNPHT